MTPTHVELVKKQIKNIIQNYIDNGINYEWTGSDFNERVWTDCYIENGELFKDVDIKENEDGGIYFDHDLYDMFLNHLVEVLFDNMKIVELTT